MYNVNTPEGTRDRLFSESQLRRNVESAITGLFKSRGYHEIITPEVEYYDLFLRSGNPLPQESMLKIVDRSGKILVMRPDNTMPVARVAATLLRGKTTPKRLYYNQTVFRSDDADNGSESEIPQCGVELIGADGLNADVEVIITAIEALSAAGLEDFQIELGHVAFFKALAGELQANGETVERIRHCIEGKKFAELNDILVPFSSKPAAAALRQLSHMFGGREVLDKASALVKSKEAAEVIEYLGKLHKQIEARGYGECVRFDLGLVQQIEYYTGLVFRGYVHGASANVLSGGRYDNLLSFFGAPAPATGFAINTGAVEKCLMPRDNGKNGRLRVAITKGRALGRCRPDV